MVESVHTTEPVAEFSSIVPLPERAISVGSLLKTPVTVTLLSVLLERVFPFPAGSVTTHGKMRVSIVPSVVAVSSTLNTFCPDTSVISVHVTVAVPEVDISLHVKLATSIGSENVAVKFTTPVPVSGSTCVAA